MVAKKKGEPETKLATVLALLARKGIVLPPDFTFNKPHSFDMLIGAIESNLATLDAQGPAADLGRPKPPVAEDGNDDDAPVSFDERGGRKSNRSLGRSLVKHLSPERAEAVAREGLRRTGYGARPRA